MSNQEYIDFQKQWYTAETPHMKVQNHSQHNSNPNYWDILLGPVKEAPDKWAGKNALDFGCGCGRNLINMAMLAKWARVDGADISAPNCRESEALMGSTNWDLPCKCYETQGTNLGDAPSDTYDFVMSTIVLQHICLHSARYSIMQDIFRVMKSGGIFSFQMGFGPMQIFDWMEGKASYYEDANHARNTNSGYDVEILDQKNLTDDLEKIGFKVTDVKITDSWDNVQHPQWIWVKAVKP